MSYKINKDIFFHFVEQAGSDPRECSCIEFSTHKNKII
jgi:hypothetical protein